MTERPRPPRPVSPEARLEPDALEALVRDIAERFDWPMGPGHLAVEERWERGTSDSVFTLLRTPSGRRIVAKVGGRWPPGRAGAEHEALHAMGGILSGCGLPGVAAPVALGWSDDPPALVTEYVEGTNLVRALQQPDHPWWDDGTMLELIAQAGRILACYHGAGPPAEPTAAREVVRKTARRLRLSGRRTRPLVEQGGRRAALAYGDYGPGNLRRGTDGAIYVFDPPSTSRTLPEHADVASFLFEVRKSLVGLGFYSTSRARAAAYPDAAHTFLEAYAAARHPFDRPADEQLLALFEANRAAITARSRWPEFPREFIRYVIWTLRARFR